MRLVSLGELRLEGEKFRRSKPLLLLAYLCLEGAKPRRFLAELFWPDKDAPMNNFAVALDHLRKLGAASADGTRVWATTACDALELREKLRAGQVSDALHLYRGAFADGLNLHDIGEELEEWLLGTREHLALELRTALLRQAEDDARQSGYAQAAQQVETAYRLPGAPALEPEELPRYYRLLRAAEHPLSKAIEREAQDLGIPLEAPVAQVREQLKPHFAGRQGEVQKLLNLPGGQWAWVQGGPGLGKTALLRELTSRQGWRSLPARAGLPYATLEPLLTELDKPEPDLLRQLLRLQTPLILDDWEGMDAESQHLLIKLHALKPDIPVILAGSEEAPFPTDLRLDLQPLTQSELQDHPGAFDATAGIPALVGAYLRGEELSDALHSRLQRLSEIDRQVYAALALLPNPDLSLVRQALHLNAPELVLAYEHLMAVGLVEPSCEVRGPSVAERYLQGEPTLAQHLSLKLARLLPKDAALPLYQRAKPIWEDSDRQRVVQAYRAWASELLKRGFPKKAAEALQDAPHMPELTLLRARALERSNAFKQALDALQDLTDTPEILALKSRLLFKLGSPDRAREAAQNALKHPDTLEAEAEALVTLGELALRKGEAQEAMTLFSRSATLWQAAGEKSRWLLALSNRAVARNLLGDPTEVVFQEVLDAAEDDLSVQAMILNNMGNSYARQQLLSEARQAYRRAIEVGTQAGALTPAILAWNGIGVILHHSQPDQARDAYQNGLVLCQTSGDSQLTAMLLANLAELDGDIPAWQQAIDLLERSGFHAMAREWQAELESFMNR